MIFHRPRNVREKIFVATAALIEDEALIVISNRGKLASNSGEQNVCRELSAENFFG